EVAKGVTLLRSLPVWSERLDLNGKCDIVEIQPLTRPLDTLSPAGGAGRDEGVRFNRSLLPVEYKKGKRRQFDNDDAQLCAQALCLEEMFGIAVERGAVFHAASKRRREVEFTPDLRQLTENAIAELHRMLQGQQVPPAEFKPACGECSLFEICLPKITSQPTGLQRAAKRLFEI